MEDEFEIPVHYQGQEPAFPSKLVMRGYTHGIQVEVNGQQIMFEPDEDQNYRALLQEADLNKDSKIEVGLLQAIAKVIESTRK